MLRRFAVVEVTSPPADQLRAALHDATGGDPNAAHAAERLLPLAEIAPLGAGVFLDAARHAAARRAVTPTDDMTLAREAYAAYVAPLLGDLDARRPATRARTARLNGSESSWRLSATARRSRRRARSRPRSGAQRVVLLLDRGDGEATMIDCDATHDTEVTEGDESAIIPAAEVVSIPPKSLPEIRPTPATAIMIDVVTGELHAPLGTVEHLADSVLALARAFGGLTVATAEFATSDPDVPITLAAREGEPVVLGAGDAQYEL